MAGAAAGQQLGHRLRLVGVVEQQQPAVVAFQPGPHRHDRRLLRCILRQLEVGGEGGVTGQGGVVAEQGRRLLAPHPPDQVVVRPLPVGMLDGKLGLADPAKARQRHPPNRKLRCGQPGMHLGQQQLAAGEVGVGMVGYVPGRRQLRREARRLRCADSLAVGAGELRLLSRLAASASGRGQQRRLGALGVPVDQVYVDPGLEQPRRLHLPDPDRQQQAPLAAGVLGVEGTPLRFPMGRRKVGGRHHRHDPLGGGGGVLHLMDPVAARGEVPRLDHNLVAVAL